MCPRGTAVPDQHRFLAGGRQWLPIACSPGTAPSHNASMLSLGILVPGNVKIVAFLRQCVHRARNAEDRATIQLFHGALGILENVTIPAFRPGALLGLARDLAQGLQIQLEPRRATHDLAGRRLQDLGQVLLKIRQRVIRNNSAMDMQAAIIVKFEGEQIGELLAEHLLCLPVDLIGETLLGILGVQKSYGPVGTQVQGECQ